MKSFFFIKNFLCGKQQVCNLFLCMLFLMYYFNSMGFLLIVSYCLFFTMTIIAQHKSINESTKCHLKQVYKGLKPTSSCNDCCLYGARILLHRDQINMRQFTRKHLIISQKNFRPSFFFSFIYLFFCTTFVDRKVCVQ